MSKETRYILFSDDRDPRLERTALAVHKKGKLKTSRPRPLISAHNSVFELDVRHTSLGKRFAIVPMESEKRKYRFDHIIFSKCASRDTPDLENFLWNFKTSKVCFSIEGAAFISGK